MRKLLCSLLLLILSVSATAQDSTVIYRISTLPSQYLFYEYRLTFEKQFNKYMLGVTFGYRSRPSNDIDINYTTIGHRIGGDFFRPGYYAAGLYNDHYSGVLLAASGKRLFGKQKRAYIELNFFYRHLGFVKDYVEYEYYNYTAGADHSFNGVRSENLDVYCLRVLMGYSALLAPGKRVSPTLDFYWGLGLRHKAYYFETFNGNVNRQYYDYHRQRGGVSIPSLHLGVKLGLEIKAQKRKPKNEIQSNRE